MIILDTNILIILIIGMINPDLISKNKRTSIYNEQDYINILNFISNKEIVVLPNIWTELDNLLNNYYDNMYNNLYIQSFKKVVQKASEKYLKTNSVVNEYYFSQIGLTDSLIIQCAKDCDFLMTADSKLSDYAKSCGINVVDIVALKNDEFRS